MLRYCNIYLMYFSAYLYNGQSATECKSWDHQPIWGHVWPSAANLEASGFPKSFANYALKHGVQTLNRERLTKKLDQELQHLVVELYGPRIFNFGEIVIFKDNKTGKRVRQAKNDLTSRGRLGLFLQYERSKSALVLDLEELKLGRIRVVRVATFVHLQQLMTKTQNQCCRINKHC